MPNIVTVQNPVLPIPVNVWERGEVISYQDGWNYCCTSGNFFYVQNGLEVATFLAKKAFETTRFGNATVGAEKMHLRVFKAVWNVLYSIGVHLGVYNHEEVKAKTAAMVSATAIVWTEENEFTWRGQRASDGATFTIAKDHRTPWFGKKDGILPVGPFRSVDKAKAHLETL